MDIECDFLKDIEDVPTCPGCKGIMTKRYGQYGTFWGCKCGFLFPEEIWGVKMGINDLNALSIGGETREYSFTWKSGKKSKARVIYDRANNKIGFRMSK